MGTYLNPIAAVDLRLALIVLPDNAELDNALGYLHDLEGFLIFGVQLEERLQARGNLREGLHRPIRMNKLF